VGSVHTGGKKEEKTVLDPFNSFSKFTCQFTQFTGSLEKGDGPDKRVIIKRKSQTSHSDKKMGKLKNMQGHNCRSNWGGGVELKVTSPEITRQSKALLNFTHPSPSSGRTTKGRAKGRKHYLRLKEIHRSLKVKSKEDFKKEKAPRQKYHQMGDQHTPMGKGGDILAHPPP